MTQYGTIDISLTSISTRMNTLPQTLQSLLDQEYSDVCIHLYLSREGHLLDKGVPELPAALVELERRAEGRLIINYVPNWGPYRKLLPYLRANWGLSKLVVTVDDDTIYPADWLTGLIEAYGRHQCVVGYRGHQVNLKGDGIAPYRSWMRAGISANPSPLILPTGKDGILYNTAFFPVNVLNIADALRLAPTVDDLWFRWHLSLNGIQTFLINTDYKSGTFDETDYDSSLYLNFNKGGGNDEAVTALERYFRDSFDFGMPDLAPARAVETV